MTLGKKLLFSSGTASTVTLLLGLIAWSNINNLGQVITKIATVNAKKLYLAGQINTATSDIVAEERGILLRSFMKDRVTINRYSQDFDQSAAQLKKSMDDFVPLIETVAARQMIGDIQNASQSIQQAHEELLHFALSGNTEAGAKLLAEKVMPLVSRVSEVGNKLAQQQNGLMATVMIAAESSASQSCWTVAGLLIVALAVCAFAMLTVSKAVQVLRKAITELAEGAEQVASAASQISSTSQSLAQGASEQAASLEETSASAEEIGSMTRRNSENSKASADLVNQSVQEFEESNRFLQQSVSAMDEINASSDKIARIIKTIDEIAFQTNILALNAAVEAARAGDAGMGFSVVADEVRSLAQRSAQAAQDTALLIEESISKSREGKIKVDQTAHAIRSIAEQSSQMKTLADEVNLGSGEQLRGIEQIAKAVSQMEQITQTAAASAEEGAAAAEELSAQSAALQEVVLRLSRMVGTTSTPVRSTQPLPAKAPRMTAGSPASISPSLRKNLPSLKTAADHRPVSPLRSTPPSRTATIELSESPLEESFQEF